MATHHPSHVLPNVTALVFCVPCLMLSNGHAQSGCTPDLNGDGIVNGADISLLVADWGATFPPQIAGVTPAIGGISGGTEVTIAGTHLRAATAVHFNGQPALAIVGASADAVVAITPPGVAGAVAIEVSTPFGSASIKDAFTYSLTPWATVLDVLPDPAIITSETLREQIASTGLPWRVVDNITNIEMLLIPAGTFQMGCSESLQDSCGGDEYPVHTVTLTQSFYLGRYEVTQSQWLDVMGFNPSEFWHLPDSPNRPVERVSWAMIQNFEAATGFRLPSEAEWEYACRAGTTSAFNNGSDDASTLNQVAWYSSSADSQTYAVGQKQANGFGVHDMHGNVWERVEDWFDFSYYSSSPAVDPPGPSSGALRVLRGGAWAYGPDFCRSSYRFVYGPGGGVNQFIGFRVARTP